MKKTILAIETSCDETAAAVISCDINSKFPKFKTLSTVVKSQIPLHKKMGGVVPEVAARAHVGNILPVTKKALKDAGLKLEDINYIAVTSGPGLIGSLIVGVEFAKALSLATGIPVLPTNHMEGHLYSSFGGEFPISKFQFPTISLIVSGGHTMLVAMKDYYNYKVIGCTMDDAAGEAFDKVAKLLRLPYPGGPKISKIAEHGKPDFAFPRPMLNSKNYDFSFSGLKTAVFYHIRDKGSKIRNKQNAANIAKAFEDAAVDVLVTKTMRAVKDYKAKSVSLGGGVAANKKLREQLAVSCKQYAVSLTVPPFRLCTDNAEMIAIAAYFNLRKGVRPVPFAKVKADSGWEIS